MKLEFYGPPAGVARLRNEQERFEALIARAVPAEGCGPEIPIAPARGPSRSVTPHVMMPDPKDKTGWKAEETGWRGFKAAQAIDIFDQLAIKAAKRDQAPPFTKGQVNAARLYRDLVERHSAGGMKLASLEGLVASGSGKGGEFMDAFLAEGEAIRRMQRAIGNGVAMQVRRVRPSARGGKTARNIRDRDLVEAICLQGKSFRQVLKGHGWTDSSRNTRALMAALAGVLDHMS
ncbi:hypothetical protein [Paracoccus saliphilus]|uniref:Uncharacterized protein n=1 Tax=Paracoccus saliphilus TaxID=405559 RepID=A0AA45W5Z1_9RHOB|nr:hypothetical protein [Paracoccus saliphilus]WCR01651.1 hypothetical protein JHX88_11975 [Paracoccus saliphilus]SIS98327.1 hypothetical protein SAMN05421772_11121 [Paracoccus saliphilus]